MKLLVTLLALSGAALAQDPVAGFYPIAALKKTSSLKAGDTFEIKWDPAPAETAGEPVDICYSRGRTRSILQFRITQLSACSLSIVVK
jgi:hypothetical protein